MKNFDEIDFDTAVELMDDDIREKLHEQIGFDCSPEEFYNAYCVMHHAKYGEDFRVD